MSQKVAVHRWDSLEVEKITEMISRKVISGDQQMWVQVYLKRGAQVPSHSHSSEQMVYVLQGSLLYRIGKAEIVLQMGEVLHVPSGLRPGRRRFYLFSLAHCQVQLHSQGSGPRSIKTSPSHAGSAV